MSTFPLQHSKLARLLPDTDAVNGTLALACPNPDCEVMGLTVTVNTTGEWAGQLSLDADSLRCPGCTAPLVPHGFTPAR